MTGIWKYGHLLPAVNDACRISLGEGNTPLVRSRQLGPMLGLDNLYFKLESTNPSGSYKDRFAAAAIAHLLEAGTKTCFATSSGNTGAALAAYSAAAGIQCFLLIVDGAPLGKLQQMQVYGAQTIMVKNFGKDFTVTKELMERLTKTATEHNSPVQISAYSYSPLGMAGVQGIAFEIAEALPDENIQVFSPAGGGGLTLSITEGFRIWKENNAAFMQPKVHCVQPEGNNTIAGPLSEGVESAIGIPHSTTKISGLQVPNVLDGDRVISSCRATGGNGYTVTDALIYECQHQMSTMEGIFSEPAGAVAFAGLRKALKKNEINKNDHIVCLVTGSGFKDPNSAATMAINADPVYVETVQGAFDCINSSM